MEHAGRMGGILDHRATRIALWIAAAAFVAAALLQVPHLSGTEVTGDPGGPYTCDAAHFGDALAAIVAALTCAAGLILLAALVPAAERQQTARWIYVAAIAVTALGAVAFADLAIFGPNLGAHVCSS